MTVMEHLQKQVKEIRNRRGWSQRKLSQQAGVPQPTIWRIEHGKIEHVSVVVVHQLARALGVGIGSLTGTDNPDVELEPAGVEGCTAHATPDELASCTT